MKKILCLLPLCHGIRLDSGSLVVNSSDFFSPLNTEVQYRPIVFPPMDAQKRNNNIVMKLTNINPMNERIKFIDCKKNKLNDNEIEKKYMALFREQLEPYMYSEKKRKRKSYKWAKKQMNKWLRIKNKKIGDDEVGGYGKKQWLGWEF